MEKLIKDWLEKISLKYNIQSSMNFYFGDLSLREKAFADLGFKENLSFPNKEISISHSKEIFVLLKIQGFNGVGIDLEFKQRNYSKKLRNRIINLEEKEVVKDFDTLKIWTIKEALFKANPQNNNTIIKNYIIKNSELASFKSNNSEIIFEYLCLDLKDFYFSCAIKIYKM